MQHLFLGFCLFICGSSLLDYKLEYYNALSGVSTALNGRHAVITYLYYSSEDQGLNILRNKGFVFSRSFFCSSLGMPCLTSRLTTEFYSLICCPVTTDVTFVLNNVSLISL